MADPHIDKKCLKARRELEKCLWKERREEERLAVESLLESSSMMLTSIILTLYMVASSYAVLLPQTWVAVNTLVRGMILPQ